MPREAVMMTWFNISGPSILLCVENMGNDSVPLAIIIFLLWGEDRELCLAVDKMTTMPPGAVMIAYFSISVPNILFCVENMENDSIPLAIIIFLLWDEDRETCPHSLSWTHNNQFVKDSQTQFSPPLPIIKILMASGTQSLPMFYM